MDSGDLMDLLRGGHRMIVPAVEKHGDDDKKKKKNTLDTVERKLATINVPSPLPPLEMIRFAR